MWKRQIFVPRRLRITPRVPIAQISITRTVVQRQPISSCVTPGKTLSLGTVTHHSLKRGYASSAAGGDLKKTSLFDFHVQNGGKMVPFGGYSMPVEYKDQSVVDSSKWTRENASLFDVSHMTQHKFSGPGATTFLETLTPSGISELPPFTGTYSTFLNDQAGIVDDTIITNITETSPASPPTFHVVTNAANHENNVAYFTDQLNKFKAQNPDVVLDWEVISNTGLIALQGPKAASVLQNLNPTSKSGNFDLSTLTFSHSAWLTLHNKDGSEVLPHPVLVSRTGYTGEDGFEISVPNPDPSSDINPTLVLTEKLVSDPSVKLAGLAARDALRLEAGLCLHGTDIDAETTPLEAGLVWIIPKSRRTPDSGFNGAAILYGDNAKPAARKRIGLVLDGKVVARHGSIVKSASGEDVGLVTSGGPSPCMDGRPIAMAIVKRKQGPKVGEEAKVVVRGKERAGKVVKMPFVPTKYYKGPGA